MAKPVDMLKSFFVNHGEKLAVGVAALACAGLAAVGLSKKPIELTPDQIKTAADQARQTLAREQPEDQVLETVSQRLAAEGNVEEPFALNFLAKHQAKLENKVTADQYRVPSQWVRQEPGAGVMRENPVVVAVNALEVSAGRGGAWVYKVDASGQRVERSDVVDADPKKKAAPRRGSRPPGYGSMMGMGMMGEGMPGMGGAGTRQESAREKREREERERIEAERKTARFTPGSQRKRQDDDAPPPASAAAERKDYDEELKGLRWVVVTGLVDNDAMRQNVASALRIDKSSAYANYKEVQVERQELDEDGRWTDWQPVDVEYNRLVTDNIPAIDADFSPEDARLYGVLVDPLPYLRIGFWTGTEPGVLVPDEAKTVVKNNAMGMMGYDGMMGSMMGMGAMGPGMGMEGGPGGRGGRGGSMMMGEGMDMSMGMMMGEGMGMMGMGAGMEVNFKKTDADLIMVRYIDYSVQPEATYRYRARLAVWNPNYGRSDVLPGTDVRAEELVGPWTDPTEPVSVPGDVAVHAIAATPISDRPDAVNFQVTYWDQVSGGTVVRDFAGAPGQILGDTANVAVADYSGDTVERKNKSLDFTSDKLVVDTRVETIVSPELGLEGAAALALPPVALLMDAEGRIIAREVSIDQEDPQRVEMRKSFRRELDEVKSSTSVPEGMFMDFGGMMGGPGGGRGGRGGGRG